MVDEAAVTLLHLWVSDHSLEIWKWWEKRRRRRKET
jgi:hypothetical protein